MSDARRYIWTDPRSRSRALESWKSFHFEMSSPPPFTVGVGSWPLILKLGHNIKSWSVTWLWTWHKHQLRRVDRQSRTGLILLWLTLLVIELTIIMKVIRLCCRCFSRCQSITKVTAHSEPQWQHWRCYRVGGHQWHHLHHSQLDVKYRAIQYHLVETSEAHTSSLARLAARHGGLRQPEMPLSEWLWSRHSSHWGIRILYADEVERRGSTDGIIGDCWSTCDGYVRIWPEGIINVRYVHWFTVGCYLLSTHPIGRVWGYGYIGYCFFL